MKSFTSYLQKCVREEWNDYYMDYLSLKNLLEKFAERRARITDSTTIVAIERFYPQAQNTTNIHTAKQRSHSFDLKKRLGGLKVGDDFHLMNDANSTCSMNRSRDDADDTSTIMTRNETVKDFVAKIERDEFCYVLDAEIRKISTLYRQQLKELKSDISLLENEIQHATADGTLIEEDGGLLQTFFQKYIIIGKEVLELHAFVGANITALRQILIRYDSLIRTLDGPPLGHWYIVTRREVYVDGDFEAIFVRHGLLLLTQTFTLALRNLQSMKKYINDEHGFAIHTEIDEYINTLNANIAEMETVVLRAERAVDKALRSRLALTDSLVYSLRYYFLAGSNLSELLLQPSFIRSRGLKLNAEIRFFAKWRTEHTLPSASEQIPRQGIRHILHASLILNFVSQFLYMMNHYIIEPSSTQYVHALGGRDALSGLLIGMTPWAGLISAFVYSYWSNKSFREPLICSGICLTLGSLLYANALSFNSLAMAMIGRFLTGLGAPCGLNVRFIADTVTKVNRTAISAILVTVSALGMSLGPFFAILLDFFAIDIHLPLFGQLMINGMTGPGYLMFFLWGIYLIFLIAFFKESERIGLHEIAALSGAYLAPSLDDRKSLESIDTYDDPAYSDDDDDILDEDKEIDQETTFEKLRYINEATVVCMGIKFIGKFVLELMGCSVSLLTRHRYDWHVKNIGTLSLVNGLLVIPISTSIGFLSQRYTDITMLFWLLGVALLGLLLLLDFTDFGSEQFQDQDNQDGYNEGAYNQDGYNDGNFFAVAPWRYILGLMLEFCGFQAAQSVILSMLSKVVPLQLAQGTFNSGFIATTISTLARANGDMLITVLGFVTIRELLNLLVVPCIILTVFCIMLAYFHQHKLAV